MKTLNCHRGCCRRSAAGVGGARGKLIQQYVSSCNTVADKHCEHPRPVCSFITPPINCSVVLRLIDSWNDTNFQPAPVLFADRGAFVSRKSLYLCPVSLIFLKAKYAAVVRPDKPRRRKSLSGPSGTEVLRSRPRDNAFVFRNRWARSRDY